MLKRVVSFFLLTVLTVCWLCAGAEEADPAGFPEIYPFGISEESIRQAMGDEGQEEWQAAKIGNWRLIMCPEEVSIAGLNALPEFFLENDKLEIFAYDFYYVDIDSGYPRVLETLYAQYGEGGEASAAEIAGKMSRVNPGFFHEEDIKKQVVWKLDSATVYLFCYSEDSFTVVYMDPAWAEEVLRDIG